MTDTYSKAAVGYERIQEILQTDIEVQDLPRARKAPKFKERLSLRVFPSPMPMGRRC
jgi:subfamily B ATP-binding cassette protein MsbA